MVDARAFGAWLFGNRKKHKLSQEALANMVGCSASYISTLENATPHSKSGGQIRPDENLVEEFAKVFHQPIDEAREKAGYSPKEATAPDLELTRLFLGLTAEQRKIVFNAAKAVRDTLLSQSI